MTAAENREIGWTWAGTSTGAILLEHAPTALTNDSAGSGAGAGAIEACQYGRVGVIDVHGAAAPSVATGCAEGWSRCARLAPQGRAGERAVIGGLRRVRVSAGRGSCRWRR